MLNLRSWVVGVLAVVLVGTGCSSPSQTETPAVVASAQTSTEIAALHAQANAGDANAQFNLARMYDTGRGVPQDDAQAMTWYRKAADQGDPDAQYNLGVMHDTGQGVPQDYVEAHKWHNLAAFRTSAENQTKYAEDRDRVANLMTPTQIADAQRLAREWQATFDARQE